MNIFLNSCGLGLAKVFNDYERHIELDSSDTSSYSSNLKSLFKFT